MKSKSHGVIVVLWTGSYANPQFWLMRYVGGPPEVFQKWAFPGGGVELREQPRDAARRELLEETGLDLGPVRLRAFGPSSIHERDDGSTFKMDYFIAHLLDHEVPKQIEPKKHGPWLLHCLSELPRPIAPSGEIAIGRFLTSDPSFQ